MNLNRGCQRVFLLLPISLVACCATTVCGQVKEVVVGITTTCPYENAIEGSCWSGAYWALTQMAGVKSVDKSANGYTCTARVYLDDKSLPDPDRWAAQFKDSVGQNYVFRGVEVTLIGTVEEGAQGPVVRVPVLTSRSSSRRSSTSCSGIPGKVLRGNRNQMNATHISSSWHLRKMRERGAAAASCG